MKLPIWFREAKRASECSDHDQYKIGACIVYKGRAISVGSNQRFKTNPLTRMFNQWQTIHGEVSAIVRLKNKKLLKDCKMVVYRENALGELAMARPCPTCLKILKFFNISSIAYTIQGGYAEEVLTKED